MTEALKILRTREITLSEDGEAALKRLVAKLGDGSGDESKVIDAVLRQVDEDLQKELKKELTGDAFMEYIEPQYSSLEG